MRNIKIEGIPYAISNSKAITKKPTKIDKYVLYRDSKQKIIMLEDRCPHRGASLSQGWNKNDNLVCPYHGWEFDKSGSLVKMPSHETSLPNCSIKKYKVTEIGGFVWVDYIPGLIEEHCPELLDPKWGKVIGSREVKGNWYNWVSNSWDPSHINYVHDFGDENDGVVHDMEVDVLSSNIIKATAKVNPKPINVFTNHMQKKKCEIETKVIIPNITRIDVLMKEPHKFITFTTIMPLSIDRSIITWSFLWNFGNQFWEQTPWIHKEFEKEMYKTVNEDEAIIKNIINDERNEVSVPADALQLKATKHLEKYISQGKISFL